MSAVYPPFYKECLSSKRNNSELESYFIKQNWLTEELITELKAFTPDNND